MDGIRIEGGRPLEGSLYIQGSKNAALPMMAASILHEGCTTLYHCPHIADVLCMERILKSLGALVRWEEDSLLIDASIISNTRIPEKYAKQMRSSITLMGSLLGRKGEASIPYPGGCTIGMRPVDFHIQALTKLGAQVEDVEGTLHATTQGLEGAVIQFEKSSVGATQNAILGAVRAKGKTWIKGAAKEPEIVWLCRFLIEMGVPIEGIGTEELQIDGGEELRDTHFVIPTDRIVTGTYVYACAITKGEVCIMNPPMSEIKAVLDTYVKMGGQYEVKSGKLTLHGRFVEQPLPYLETGVYPGFPTDLQSPLMAVLTTLDGNSHIRETVFEDRYQVSTQLIHMGARIFVKGKDAWIEGVSTLRGRDVVAQELRGGAALILAGLRAPGITYIENRHFIERGYENFCENITSLGGIITKV